MSNNITMKDIVNLCQNRGFVYPGSEIYGGLANSWDYGPYGSLLKENIKNLWLKEFIQKRTDNMLIDASLIMNPKVWEASGHVGGFADPLMDCKECRARWRADKLIDNKIEDGLLSEIELGNIVGHELGYNDSNIHTYFNTINYRSIYDKLDILKNDLEKNAQNAHQIKEYNYYIEKYRAYLEYKDFLKKYAGDKTETIALDQMVKDLEITCPDCGNKEFSKIKKFNLMLKTFLGVTEDSSSVAYLRPETAQGQFVDFVNVARSSRRKLPFGIAQVGKSFRNEITPGNFIFRTREFEQMEIEYFVTPGEDDEAFEMWKQNSNNFFVNLLGLNQDNIRFAPIKKEELPHYSKEAGDFDYKYPFGWGEIETLANRTDYDLNSHMKASKQNLSYFDAVNNKRFLPYVIEPAMGLGRITLAVICDAYTIDEENNRIYLKFEPKVAPIKVGVLPVVKKIGNLAKEIYSQLAEDFVCEYDEVGSIGKRFARMDEIGVPFCISVDSSNYDEGKVTVRFRDSMEQEIVEIEKLNEFIKSKLK